jgi:hypothetical protein
MTGTPVELTAWRFMSPGLVSLPRWYGSIRCRGICLSQTVGTPTGHRRTPWRSAVPAEAGYFFSAFSPLSASTA